MQQRLDQFSSAFDRLRAAAMLLGVALHALIPYMTRPVPHLLWPIREPATFAFDTAYWWIHGFRVQLFFFLAGILAIRSVRRLGAGEFARRRSWRLGVPLLVGTPVVVGGLMYPVWAWGWVRSGLAEPMHVAHVRFGHGMQQDLYGLAHLWFLEYMLIFCWLLAIAFAAVPAVLRESSDVGTGRGRIVILVALAAVSVVVLGVDPRCLTEFHNWFLPRGSEFAHHGLFFLGGVAVGANVATLSLLSRWWWVLIVAAQAAFVLLIPRVSDWAGPGEWKLAALAAAYGWCSVLGWFGLIWRVPLRVSSLERFLSGRAYWLYLIHPPLVGMVQVLLWQLSVAPWIKALAAFLVAVIAAAAIRDPLLRLWQWAIPVRFQPRMK
jgi:hypothetical protein